MNNETFNISNTLVYFNCKEGTTKKEIIEDFYKIYENTRFLKKKENVKVLFCLTNHNYTDIILCFSLENQSSLKSWREKAFKYLFEDLNLNVLKYKKFESCGKDVFLCKIIFYFEKSYRTLDVPKKLYLEI